MVAGEGFITKGSTDQYTDKALAGTQSWWEASGDVGDIRRIGVVGLARHPFKVEMKGSNPLSVTRARSSVVQST